MVGLSDGLIGYYSGTVNTPSLFLLIINFGIVKNMSLVVLSFGQTRNLSHVIKTFRKRPRV